MRRRWLGRRWLGILIFAPLVLGGCKAASGVASPVPSPSGSPWVITVPGSATPSPAPSVFTALPSTFPTGYLPLPSGSAATPTPTGSSTCPPDASHDIAGATVVPGSTSAAVTFYHQGGSVVEYRITAISQDLLVGQQRDVGWTVVTPGSGCGYLTATVSGLDPRTRYVFSVDEVTTKLGKDGTQASTVARSGVVTTT